ncbi:hypothetical protein DESUT3_31310 [Desulfuromonas versatilis]|uniref:Fibronectin type-III domain-containing protein n=1 Tax=Desulfuromonas versatilis TaxID=2802975 RepID=A0ABM8HVV7_9BACT|nr:hypothetical protein [Desulfuromonas versatilis]BCR06062.1 hypothetical protein DESUT3_31310 [Desulfuromonas versatilis]
MRIYGKILSLFFLAAVCFLLPGAQLAFGAPVPGIDVTYTRDADFHKGTLLNLNHEGVNDQLQLGETTEPFPFIYVANSGRGSIVRIDVNTGTILGEYYTSPNGMGKNPSRTTVDQVGNVWVSNRDESGFSVDRSKGSITRVGLVIGGTRVNSDGSINPTGQFLKPPFQYNTCIDRNSDGLIKTSRAADNRLSWNNTGGADTHGGVTTAEDECIINYTRVAATNTRTVAIDANNDVWVGGANTIHEKVSGITGQPVPGTSFNLGCGGYGGLVDKNGVLWSARYGSGLLRFDTKTMTGSCLGKGRGDYGLGVDPNTGEIWHTFLEGNRVAKLAPNGTLLGIFNHGSHYAQGVVVDKGSNVWVAHSLYGSTVGHLRTDGTYVGSLTTDSGPTGVAVDANGKVWSTNYYFWTANRINPESGAVGGGGFRVGAVDKAVSLGASAYPYNYSDMTGYVALGGTSSQGTWYVVQDSGVEGNKWGTVTWNKEAEGTVPEGALILVEARTSDTEAGLSGKNFTALSNNQPFSLAGRFIEVRVTMKPSSSGEKPVLSDLRISMTPINNVRVIDTISSSNIVIDPNSFTQQPYSINYANDKAIIEWRFDAFAIGQIQDLSYRISLKSPIAGENRLVSHSLEVLYTDINGNTVRNEIGPQFVQVLDSKYATLVRTDKLTYGVEEDSVISAEITNQSQFSKTLDAKISIEDGSGALVQEVEALSGLMFAAGETKNFNGLVFNTGATYAGNYRVKLVLFDGQSQVGSAVTDFTIVPSIAVKSGLVTDKVSYNPNEEATITATVTNQSLNYAMENLTAKVTVSSQNPEGSTQLYSGTKEIPVLMQGGSTNFKSYWNTATHPAGSYLVTVEVMDASGALVSTSTRDLVISSITKPTALLKGQISLDKNSLLSGDVVTATYSVSNSGNLDLANVGLSIRTIHLTEEIEYHTIADQTALNMGATYTNNGLIDTQGYSAKDYLVVLQANIDGVEESLAGAYFRVEGAPSAPALIGPMNGADVETFTPSLVVSNAADPNDDNLTYEFEVYRDSGLSSLIVSGMAFETASSTAWTVSDQLFENETYYWRVRAYDGHLYGPWMTPAAFRVNTVNDPPTAPTISSPEDWAAVAVLNPVLTVNNSTDPDSTNLTYNFDLAFDPDFTQVVASVAGVESDDGTTSWTVPISLQENGLYYWRAQADDWLIEGPWSTVTRFFVNTANDSPSAPVVTVPANGSVVPALETDIVVTNSEDPDSTSLVYYFEVDTVATFDSATLMRSDAVAEGVNVTTWFVSGLQENTRYFVRVKASDGMAESAWSTVVKFMANTVNDPPTIPALDNPSDGTGVNSFTPTLSVHNSMDLDGDALTYEFEVYQDSALANLIAQSGSIVEMPDVTAWEVPIALVENQTYFWRARSFDGTVFSEWMPMASFMVNTANDAPGAPLLLAPADGRTLEILTPTLMVKNAIDPDSDQLTYDFEVYSNNVLIDAKTGILGGGDGTTSVTLETPLSDKTSYNWRARAFDGDRYGQWMNLATFTTHIPRVAIKTDIKFEPETLNQKSKGTWVKVDIFLPAGYKAEDVDITSIRLEEIVPAEPWPFSIHHGKDEDKLTVKFRRDAVISVLPEGQSVPVHVTGDIGSTPFEGMDIIRVIH